MKRYILYIFILSGIVFANKSFAQYYNPYSYSTSTIKDGWYEATIRYQNFSTGTIANYTLNVKVEDDEVVEIAFPDGGYIHRGYNNEGYLWMGGELDFNKDYNGNIASATARVTTSDSKGERVYEITIGDD